MRKYQTSTALDVRDFLWDAINRSDGSCAIHCCRPIHLPAILLLPPLLHPATQPANPPLPTPQMVPPDPALLPPPPHLQAVPGLRARHALIQECGIAEEVEPERCVASGGLDDEGRGRAEGGVDRRGRWGERGDGVGVLEEAGGVGGRGSGVGGGYGAEEYGAHAV